MAFTKDNMAAFEQDLNQSVGSFHYDSHSARRPYSGGQSSPSKVMKILPVVAGGLVVVGIGIGVVMSGAFTTMFQKGQKAFVCTDAQSVQGNQCVQCENATYCSECAKGWGGLGAGPGTPQYLGTKATCPFLCTDEQKLGSCTQCTNSTHCDLCAEGWKAHHGTCHWECDTKQEEAGCVSCLHETECTECKAGLTLMGKAGSAAGKTCVYKCSLEQEQAMCVSCSSTTKCDRCQPGYAVMNGECITECLAKGEDDLARVPLDDDGNAKDFDPKVRNGYEYRRMCIDEEVGHFFILGDWGGAWAAHVNGGQGGYLFQNATGSMAGCTGLGASCTPKCKDPRSNPECKPGTTEPCCDGAAGKNTGRWERSNFGKYNDNDVDERAQTAVANTMMKHAKEKKPRFVVNAGDSFYWGGFEEEGCGWAGWPDGSVYRAFESQRWKQCFENKYDMPHPTVQGHQIPWMGVLGNHDHGGMYYDSGWDHQIYYTYKQDAGFANRWRMPGMWWSQKVIWPTFTLELFFLDGNYLDAKPANVDPHHNLCNKKNPYKLDRQNGTCSGAGYKAYDIKSCFKFHHGNWADQMVWLREGLSKSQAHYTGVVAHYPNNFDEPRITGMLKTFAVDLLIAGHSHFQVLGQMKWKRDPTTGKCPDPPAPCSEHGNPNKPFTDEPLKVISGGGGGISSEAPANPDNNMYGFMDVEMTLETVTVQIINYAGVGRDKWVMKRRKKVAREEVEESTE